MNSFYVIILYYFTMFFSNNLLQSDAENSVAETKISEIKVRVTRDTDNNDADQAADATGGKIYKYSICFYYVSCLL